MAISREQFKQIGRLGKFIVTEDTPRVITLENERAAIALEDVDVRQVIPRISPTALVFKSQHLQIDISPSSQDPRTHYLGWSNPQVEFVPAEGEPEKAVLTSGRKGLDPQGDVKITVSKDSVLYENIPTSSAPQV